MSGIEHIDGEALLLCLQIDDQFGANVRSERDRYVKRLIARVRSAMTAEQRGHYDRLDMGKHGEGM